jgi:shikimate dehydrogenase
MSEINATTRVCAVYGHPVKHSASPVMQNAGIAKLELNWRYLAFDVHPDMLRIAINGAKAMRYIGLNLTVPHKVLAYDMVDHVDERARYWGAVNTIRFEGRIDNNWWPLAELPPEIECETRSVGYNTDADAIIQALREDLDFNLLGARVLIVGAGGAGRAAALRIAREIPGELWLFNRTAAKAQEVAGAIRSHQPNLHVKVGVPKGKVDLVINATSLGLKESDPLPIQGSGFTMDNAAAAFDMIYRPHETPFLKAARELGCKTSNGAGMLLYQGARALEIWSGQTAPVAAMKAALHKHIYG